MDSVKYLSLLVVLCFEGTDSGGHHGGKHHHHLNIHVPEFIHHDFHTKVITIHHHHHKPKKEHHHHHHHHHKPHVPHYHYHHNKKSHKTLTTSTVSKNGGHHVHHTPKIHHVHQGHRTHHDHFGNLGPVYRPVHHNHYIPKVNHDPIPTTTFEDDFGSLFKSAVPSYGSEVPRVRGVTHKVKQVNVYDSLPGAIPVAVPGHQGGPLGGPGYQVTEPEEEDEDSFTSINTLQENYPDTYGYLRGAAEEPASHDPFGPLLPPPRPLEPNYDPFATVPQSVPAVASENDVSAGPPGNFPVALDTPVDGFSEDSTGFVGSAPGNNFATDEKALTDDTPVSFSREAGIQQTVQTGGHEIVVY